MKQKRVAIHGLGYLGYTNLSHFVNQMIPCLAHDYMPYDRNRSDDLVLVSDYFESVFSSKNQLVNSKQLYEVVDNVEALFEEPRLAHLICVPTEEEGRPNLTRLESILKGFTPKRKEAGAPFHLILESTLFPNMIADFVLPILKGNGLTLDKDFYLSVAVRQDWVKSEFFEGAQPKKIVSGVSAASLEHCEAFYAHTKQSVLVSKDAQALELIKHIENGLHLLQQSYINQLHIAYPNQDFVEIGSLLKAHLGLELEPKLGTGGFRTPISSRVLMDYTPRSDYLTLLKEAVLTDLSMMGVILDDLRKREVEQIAILGVSSDSDIWQFTHSPYARLAELLAREKFQVAIYDPYAPQEELTTRVSQVEVLEDPYDLGDAKAVIVGTPHRWTRFLEKERFLEALGALEIFLDNGSFVDWAENIQGYQRHGCPRGTMANLQ